MSLPRDQLADWTGMIDHETIIALARLIQTLSCVGNPAPVVKRIGEWCRAEPRLGDLVVEMSSHRIDTDRVGLWLRREDRRVCRHEREDVDHPGCSDQDCAEWHSDDMPPERFVWILVQREPERKCRWHNASFIRIPYGIRQLNEASGIDKRPGGWQPVGTNRDDLISLLLDRGIEIKP